MSAETTTGLRVIFSGIVVIKCDESPFRLYLLEYWGICTALSTPSIFQRSALLVDVEDTMWALPTARAHECNSNSNTESSTQSAVEYISIYTEVTLLIFLIRVLN